MTRGELRARIQNEIERRGYAAVTLGDLWAAFAAPGEDTTVPFDDALRGFAAVNGWEMLRGDGAPADTFSFRPARPTRERK